jgi:hypothetical protein
MNESAMILMQHSGYGGGQIDDISTKIDTLHSSLGKYENLSVDSFKCPTKNNRLLRISCTLPKQTHRMNGY